MIVFHFSPYAVLVLFALLFFCFTLNRSFIFLLGRVLNRFSKDIGQIDELLPDTFFDYTRVGGSLGFVEQVCVSKEF